jgi:hypothetical protein
MASKTYLQHYFDGSAKLFTRKKQGRIPSPPELVKVPLTINVLPARKAKLILGAKMQGISLSSYCETALVMYDYAIYHSEELLKP